MKLLAPKCIFSLFHTSTKPTWGFLIELAERKRTGSRVCNVSLYLTWRTIKKSQHLLCPDATWLLDGRFVSFIIFIISVRSFVRSFVSFFLFGHQLFSILEQLFAGHCFLFYFQTDERTGQHTQADVISLIFFIHVCARTSSKWWMDLECFFDLFRSDHPTPPLLCNDHLI
jgi:hypothetical protein